MTIRTTVVIVGADEFATVARRCAQGEAVSAIVETQGRYVPGNTSVTNEVRHEDRRVVRPGPLKELRPSVYELLIAALLHLPGS